jgi:hypothetical protein
MAKGGSGAPWRGAEQTPLSNQRL